MNNRTFVLFVGGDLLGRCLDLEDELDTLDRSDGGLRHGSGDTTGQEVLSETVGVFRCLGFGHFCCCKDQKEYFGKKIEC